MPNSSRRTEKRKTERHKQNTNPKPIYELEPSSEREPEVDSRIAERAHEGIPVGDGITGVPDHRRLWAGRLNRELAQSDAGGSGGEIDARGQSVAYQDACETMGPENAAAVMACILERAGHINSAGGYLRDLTARARRDEFSLGPMLMAMLRSRTVDRQKVS